MKAKFNTIYCTTFMLFCILWIPQSMQAVEQTYPGVPLTGTAIQNGATLITTDALFSNSSTWISDQNIRYQDVQNHVLLRVNTTVPSVDYTVTVTLQVTYTTEDGTSTTISPNPVLTVEYNNTAGVVHQDKDAILFEGGHEVSVQVLNVNYSQGSPTNLILENTININRLFNFNVNTPPANLAVNQSPLASNEIEITWDAAPGAEQYQLEWAHINNYNGTPGGTRPASQLYYNFDNNATRIATVNEEYRVSLVFEQGYVLFRVRALTCEETDHNQLIPGVWTSTSTSPQQLSSHPASATFLVTTAHESDAFNWQYSASYAEEGKKKEIITYFDGSLRNQQIVTKINTDSQTIVGEIFYDHQGRAAIQALPAPAANSRIEFYPNFNQAGNGIGYSRDNFDLSQNSCEILATPMVTNSGASRYYSPDNPNQQKHQAYVPDAEQYPFTHIEYESDNTERIRREGGVGPEYQLGSGHETKYFYGKPSQEHLNRLFASEVGYFSHYKKNMVIDPNGQVSLSYIDQKARIIATALAGNSPQNLTALSSNNQNNPESMTINIIDNQPLELGLDSWISVYHHLVTTAGEHDFTYALEGVRFENDGDLPNDVCLDCVYDLEIDILDECGERPDLTNTSETLPITITIGTLDDLCSSQPEDYNIDFSAYFDLGKYVISRTLKLNQEALQEHTQTYITQSDSVIQLIEFIEEAISLIDETLCEDPDCETDCISSLGVGATQAEIDACVLGCEFPDRCAASEEIMIGDFIPGIVYGDWGGALGTETEATAGGQYALYNQIEVLNNGGIVIDYTYDATDPTSFLTENNLLGIHYSSSDLVYLDELGNPAMVINAAGQSVTPNELVLEEFIEAFQPSWAKALLPYHPEKCFLDFCDESGLGARYSFIMNETDTYEEALALGFLNPLQMSGAGIPNFPAPTGVWALPDAPEFYDPFFGPDGKGYTFLGDMTTFLQGETLYDTDGTAMYTGSAWEIAVLLGGACQDTTNMADCQDIIDDYFTNPEQADICNRDMVWLIFRSRYQDERLRLYYQAEALYMNNAADCANPFPIGDGMHPEWGDKNRHFPPFEALMGEANMAILNNTSPTVLDEEITANEEAMDSICLVRAEAMSVVWMENLAGCVGSGAVWEAGNSDFDNVREGLINIMLATCDFEYPFGASTLPDGEAPLPPNQYAGFAEVISGVLGAGNIDLSCNADLISFPKAYGHEYASLTDQVKIDTCGCDNILYSDSLFYDLDMAGGLPQDIENAQGYFEYTYDAEIYNYNSKVCACRDAFSLSGNPWNSGLSWAEISQEALVSSNEYIDAGVGCVNCEGCDDLINAANAYQAAWEADMGIDIDTLPPPEFSSYQSMLTTHLNNQFNLDLSFFDYDDFMADCTTLAVGDTSLCNTLTPEGTAFTEILTTIISTTNGTDTICLCEEPFVDAYGNILVEILNPNVDLSQGCADIYYPTVITNTSISVELVGETTCNWSLEFTDPQPGYDITNIFGPLVNVRPAPGTTPGNTGQFLAEVLVAVGSSPVYATILGTSDCYELWECVTDINEVALCNYQFTIEPESDDCLEHLTEIAIQNATSEYESYIDSIITAIQEEYGQQCLAATDSEVFDMTFEDNEHHYTLYYYDQAGNLVRTIPPGGVELVPENQWTQIDAGRASGQQTVFTKHRMETRYKYNTINQLTHQSMPDHDNFGDVQTSIAGAGLPPDMSVTSTTFSDDNNGVLFGIDPADPDASLIFITNDGGATWTQANNLGIDNINEVQAYGGGIVYAVGDMGSFLKTTDGGANWTFAGSGTTDRLIDLYFETANVNNGLVFSDGGKIFQTGDGGMSWSMLTSDLENISQLHEVYFVSDNTGYAVGTEGVGGVIYLTTDGGQSWTKNNQIIAMGLNDVQYLNGNTAYAVGEHGTLLRNSNGGQYWQVIGTQNQHTELKRVHFTDNLNGIALDNNDNLIHTSSGGVSWSGASGSVAGTTIKDFYFVNATGFALDDNKNVYQAGSNLNNWTLKGTILSPQNMNTLFFSSTSNGYAGGNNGLIFETTDGGISWISTAGSGLTGNIVKLYETVLTGGITLTVNVALNSAGQLFYQLSTSSNWIAALAPAGFNAIDFHFIANTGTGYALSSNGSVYKTTNGGQSWSAVQGIGSSGVKSIHFADANQGSVVGNNGLIFNTDNGGTSWTDATDNIIPLPFYDVHVNGNTAFVVGDDGTLLVKSGATGNPWQMTSTETSENLRSCFLKSPLIGAIAGANGTFRYTTDYTTGVWNDLSISGSGIIEDIALAGNIAFALTESKQIFRTYNIGVNPLTSIYTDNDNLNAIDIDGIEAYVVGDNGTILKTDNIGGTTWNDLADNISPSIITASTATPNGNLYAVTEDGTVGISTNNGNSWAFSSLPSSGDLNGIHFANDNRGLIVGDNGAVFLTTDSGTSWTILSVPGALSTNFNDVFLLNQNAGFIVGDGGRILRINNINSGNPNFTDAPSGTNENLNSVHFGGSIGYIAGDNGTLLKTESGLVISGWNLLIALNGEDWVAYTDPNNAAVTANLQDIVCQDATTAYAAGDNGVVIKTTDGGISWSRVEQINAGNAGDINEITFNDDSEFIISSNNAGGGFSATQVSDGADRWSSCYFYDVLGRLIASQNSKQYSYDPPRYSYTKYDHLGRVVESGELISNTKPTEQMLNATNYPDNWSLNRLQVNKTFYDIAINKPEVTTQFTPTGQQNLRNRAATTVYQEIYDVDVTTYDHASHYSYDIHGNVAVLVQENAELHHLGQGFKKMIYEYDLISGNVHKVKYQEGEADQFSHRYEYDGDNRITHVYTSADGALWDRDAIYEYYEHRPLARTLVGDLGVQGCDYAYTKQGWLKGLNSNTLIPGRDIGKDGSSGIETAKDVYGYGLHYYGNDYSAIGGTTGGNNDFMSGIAGTPLGSQSPDLFNGNISKMVTAISPVNGQMDIPVQGNAYHYDQLNRILQSHSYRGNNVVANNTFGGANDNGDYQTQYSYDPNGNILSLLRKGHSNNGQVQSMDDLSYHYDVDVNGNIRRNRLLHVNDPVADGNYNNDIDDQGSFDPKDESLHNYAYDGMGKLIKDEAEDIAEIIWKVDGKVQKIIRKPGSDKADLLFKYDGSGNRITKVVFHKNVTLGQPEVTYTHYVRDASGNVMAIYKREQTLDSGINEQVKLVEHQLYGKSRLGIRNVDVQLGSVGALTYTTNVFGEKIMVDGVFTAYPFGNDKAYRLLGAKQYELSNHLGNVLNTVSDRKLLAIDGSFLADVTSVNDYYPFGMTMGNRTVQSEGYRYGFNGMEFDNELKEQKNSYTTHFRQYDPRLGRWLSPDPVIEAKQSPYVSMDNNPILNMDPDGDVAFCCGPWGALKGAVSEYASQVAGNVAKDGLSLSAFTDIDVADVTIAAVLEAAPPFPGKSILGETLMASIDAKPSTGEYKAELSFNSIKEGIMNAALGKVVEKTVAKPVEMIKKNSNKIEIDLRKADREVRVNKKRVENGNTKKKEVLAKAESDVIRLTTAKAGDLLGQTVKNTEKKLGEYGRDIVHKTVSGMVSTPLEEPMNDGFKIKDEYNPSLGFRMDKNGKTFINNNRVYKISMPGSKYDRHYADAANYRKITGEEPPKD